MCRCYVERADDFFDLATAAEEGTRLDLWVLKPKDKATSFAKFTNRRLRVRSW